MHESVGKVKIRMGSGATGPIAVNVDGLVDHASTSIKRGDDFFKQLETKLPGQGFPLHDAP